MFWVLISSIYIYRWTYAEFFQRYRVLAKSADINRKDYLKSCHLVLPKLIQVRFTTVNKVIDQIINTSPCFEDSWKDFSLLRKTVLGA